MSIIKQGLSRLTFWKGCLAIILMAGLYASGLRLFSGLGASTNLSDEFPWGLWIGFDVLCGVALAAGGFTLSAVVYLFHLKRFQPIVRPAIVTAFLGYSLVIVALLFDLGRSERIWHPLIMWNPRSVMFEVAWCVILYSTVLALEFSPMLFERLGWEKPNRVIHILMVPLVIMGVVLSTLHQSSLGSLFLIVPGKLHPLWYSPWLPVFFFISAVALGCAMTILESFISHRGFRRMLEVDLLADLGKVIVVVLSLFLVIRFQDITNRGAWELVFQPSYEGRMFLAEILLGTIGPIVLLFSRTIRTNPAGLFISSCMVICGFIMNRLNISITGMERSSGFAYTPRWTEVAVTVMLVGLGFLLFAAAVRYLNVFPRHAGLHPAKQPELPAPAMLRRPLPAGNLRALVVGGTFFLLALALAIDGNLRRSDTPDPSGAPSIQALNLGERPLQPGSADDTR